MEITIGRGDERRKVPVESAPERDLKYYAENANIPAIREACVAEIKRRAAGGAVSAPPPPAGSVPREEATKSIQQFSGAHTDAARATVALQKIQEIGHLISPAPACAVLPVGTAISISAFMIDAKNETFKMAGSGQLGIAGVALAKFASAACVSWSPECHRVDDRSDAHYAEFSAVGYVRNLDGSRRRITGTKVMDLREGSPQLEAMRQQAEAKFKREHDAWESNEKKGPEPKMGDWASQLRDQRLRIAEHAETKAKYRAIRSMGLRSSYTLEELSKPFFVVSLQFTGQSDEPEIRKMFAGMIGDAFLGGRNQLYGRESDPEPQRIVSTRKPPPIEAVGESLDDEDGIPMDDDFPT